MADLSQDQIMGWINNKHPEEPATRLAYGGVTSHGYVHLKTLTGEVLKYPLSFDTQKKGDK